MTVLLVILAVLGAVLVALLLVLLLPLSVRVKYAETLEVFAGIAFVKFKVFPKEETEKKGKKEKKKVKKSADKQVPEPQDKTPEHTMPRQSGEDKEQPKKKGISDTLKLVFEIIKSVFDVMGKRAKITIDELYVVVSKPDAADTAVQFGLCGGIVSNILAFTSNFKKAVINDEKVGVVPDFITGKSGFRTDITLSIAAGSLLMSFIKGYLKGISRK